ncbi:MAG: Asp-tRNA(Asn)/Glu-tRNA(Gln) amidotransferase subunit GatC [Microthrixaceae bacterium]
MTEQSPPITAAEVTKVAKLARLTSPMPSWSFATHQLGDILGHAADIEALDLADVEPMARPIPLTNVFRPDEPGEPLDRDDVLSVAPAVEDNQFRVPPSLGEDS